MWQTHAHLAPRIPTLRCTISHMPVEDAFPSARRVIEDGIARGLHAGAQLYVSLEGRTIADLVFGHARDGVPMTPAHLNLWMSATKPVAAVAIAQLWEAGRLELDDRVARHIPEFAQNGKEPITLRHILTHTAGFRTPPRNQMGPWDQIIAELCAARLEPGWVPGLKAGYHPASSWFILGEVVRRVSELDYGAYVRQRVFEPLGMTDCWIGMPLEQLDAYGDRIAVMHKLAANGSLIPLDPRPVATSTRPGSSGYGPIRQLGRFYEMLLARGLLEGTRVLLPQSVEAITARHRSGLFDQTFKRDIDWGLGFLLNSYKPDAELPYGYGPRASPRTFGHGGAESSGAFCDPDRGLVVAYVFNGQPGEERHHERRKAVVEAVYDDLGVLWRGMDSEPACPQAGRGAAPSL
jgi:CubicO group peptidase (beta-lactamase class C family)